MTYDFGPPPTTDSWRTSSLAYEVSLYSGNLYWGDKLAFSVVPPVCLSSFLESGVKTVLCIRTKFSGWIDPTGGRVILYFSGVHDARGTWHVPQREGLHKRLAISAGQTGGTTDPKFTGHTYTAPTCVLSFVVAVPVGCRLHAPGSENLFDVGSSGARKFLARDTKLGRWVHLGIVYLVLYDLMGWSALCTCSASASVLYLFFFCRHCRQDDVHHRFQSCMSHVYCPNLYAFPVAVLVCGARARSEKNYSRGVLRF